MSTTADDITKAADAALRVIEAVDAPWLYEQTSGQAPQQDIDTFLTADPAYGYPELVIYDRENANAWLQSSAFLDPMETSFQ